MITVAMEMTAAKIGRSTKKCANFIERPSARRRQRRRLRRHLGTRARALKSGDDDCLISGEALADDAIAVLAWPGADDLRGDGAVRGHDHHEAPVLIGR